MNIAKYNYPHPILGKPGNFKDDIIEHIPEFDLISGEHRIKINLDLKNQTIRGLISTGKAKLICEISCSSTFFRKAIYANDENPYNEKLLRNKVEILVLVVAIKNISDYKPIGVKEFYFDKTFSIESGDVLAFIGNYYRNVDMEGDTSSDFIKLVKDNNSEVVQFDMVSDYIRIRIPTSQYIELNKIKNDSRFNDILISSYVVPALHNALCHFLKDNTEDYSFSNYQWFQFLEFKIKEYYGSEENIISIEQIPEIIEKLLNNSSKRLVESLSNLTHQFYYENVEYE